MSEQSSGILFVFPGQGAQYLGMGQDVYERYPRARAIYDEACDVLSLDLKTLSFEDPGDELVLTRNTQPALLTHHIACLEAWRETGGNAIQPDMAAGHSLGEYSALVAAGTLSFADALRLVRRRGELMGQHGEGEMTAFTLDLDTLRPLADKHFCGIAGCNLPDQTVVGGRPADLDAMGEEVLALYPRKRAVRLKTEGAFHTYYMVTTAQHFRAELDSVEMAEPGIRVLSNYTGGYHEPDPGVIKARLFFQLFHPVQWLQNLQTAVDDGTRTIVEFGGGIGTGETPAEKRANLEGIVKKAFRRADQPPVYHAAINVDTIEATAAALTG
jgi:[acyl-carrier-protein] S-malonyltransferase